MVIVIPYFFGYKTGLFPFQNIPKISRSYKTDPDLWNSLERVKLVLNQNYIGLFQLFVVIVGRGKPRLKAD